MAATFILGDITPVDGLCPFCFLPAVVDIEVLVNTATGAQVYHRMRCRDCRTHVGRVL